LNAIPLVRASQLGPFVEAAERIGVPVERHLEAARLPPGRPPEAGAMIARQQLWSFAEAVRVREGLPEFGLLAATQDPVGSLGSFGERLRAAPTLFSALHRLVREIAGHSTHASFRIESWGDGVRIVRSDVGYLEAGAPVVEQFVVLLLVGIVRCAASTWTPTQVWLRARDTGWRARHPLLADARAIAPSGGTAIYVPRRLLAHPMRAARGGQPIADSPRLGSFTDTLEAALAPLVGEVPLDLRLVQEITGASERTVRRQLSAEGRSWRALLDDLRFGFARDRLSKESVRVEEVALQLGYSDAAHFARAFRRWAHVTPSEYRRGCRDAELAATPSGASAGGSGSAG